MKVSVGEERTIVLEEVYNSICLKTAEGFEVAICMRDDGFEIGVEDRSAKTPDGTKVLTWHRIGPDLCGGIEPMVCEEKNVDPDRNGGGGGIDFHDGDDIHSGCARAGSSNNPPEGGRVQGLVQTRCPSDHSSDSDTW